jgi:hypothetical protein
MEIGALMVRLLWQVLGHRERKKTETGDRGEQEEAVSDVITQGNKETRRQEKRRER